MRIPTFLKKWMFSFISPLFMYQMVIAHYALLRCHTRQAYSHPLFSKKHPRSRRLALKGNATMTKTSMRAWCHQKAVERALFRPIAGPVYYEICVVDPEDSI